MHDPPGLDVQRFGAWFGAVMPDLAVEDLQAELLTGGKSNLTYRVEDGRHSWVVRRPPLGHVLATAHDMAREHRVISALAHSAVPVPRTYGLCEDLEVIGAPFYVMERLSGTPYRTAADLERLGPARTRLVCEQLVDTLARLHELDPEQVGLGDFGRPEGFAQRQLSRWSKQLASSRSRDLPLADTLHDRLLARLPPGPTRSAIVHGDYRLDNVLMGADDRPDGVIDWEMATLGDPLTDVALLVVYGRLARLPGALFDADASGAPGYLSDEEILARYEQVSGRALGDIGFYLGLAGYKLAAILEGIHFRALQGQTVGPGFDGVGDAVQPLLETGLTMVEEHS